LAYVTFDIVTKEQPLRPEVPIIDEKEALRSEKEKLKIIE
jgi:hypothetical protein